MIEPIVIARREEWRIARSLSEIARVVEPFAGGVMCYDGPGSWSNQACGCGLAGLIGEAELDRLVAFYDDHNEPGEVELPCFADESLISGLGVRGFVLKYMVTVMACQNDPNGPSAMDRLPRGAPAGITIDQMAPGDDQADRAYVHFAASLFDPPGGEVTEVMIQTGLSAHRHPRNTSFVAWDEGRMVGVAGMETTTDGPFGPIGCLYGGAVAQSHRRRGIQQALIAARMDHARAVGCPVLTILTKPGIPTERNAMRLGFSPSYAKAVLGRPGPSPND